MTANDDELAAVLAEHAGRILLEVRSAPVLTGKGLGAAGDAVSHQWLMHALHAQRPDDGVLSEEGARAGGYLQHERIWIVDPLDGTREYSEGREDWAVHVALVVAGAPVASAVALPARGTVLSSAEPIPLGDAGERLRIAVSRTRPPAVAEHVARELDAELVPMGSAGWKAMAVVRGDVDAYLHGGGMYEWDSCAPAGVAAHAGLHVSTLDGSALQFGKPEPQTPELVICRPEIAASLLDTIARCTGQLVE